MVEKLTIKAFLSHRYNSTKINLYFFDLIKQCANIQFEVDEGSLSTNVTRLERMIKKSDIFIGIYPVPSKLGRNPLRSEIEKSCRYFKLEIDIASRLKKPSLFLIDNRFGNILPISNSRHIIYYDSQEIVSDGGCPNEQYFKTTIQNFFQTYNQNIQFKRVSKSLDRNLERIIIYTDENASEDSILNTEFGEKIKLVLEEIIQNDVVICASPIALSENFYKELESVDFIVINITNNQNLGIYIHTNGIPQIRINSGEKLERFLYGNFTVGYDKDVIKTIKKEQILKEIKERIITISSPTIRINTDEQALEYFKKASLRKETIFVSYSGKDEDTAMEIIKELKQNFSKVFDYRDKAESILPGKPWIEEIFDSLSKSSLGIMLFTESYFESENCMHELREIIAAKDSKRIKVLPIKLLNNKTLKIPSFVQDLQYIRYWEYENQSEIVKMAIRLIEDTPPSNL